MAEIKGLLDRFIEKKGLLDKFISLDGDIERVVKLKGQKGLALFEDIPLFTSKIIVSGYYDDSFSGQDEIYLYNGRDWEIIPLTPVVNNWPHRNQISGNGNYMLYTPQHYQGLYISSYNGTSWSSWTNIQPTTSYPYRMVISYDGSKIVAFHDVSNIIHFSTNYGVSWTSSTISGTTLSWVRGVISNDGGVVVLVSNFGVTRKTTDWGNSWTELTPGGVSSIGTFYPISISSDGTKIFACCSTKGIYYSSDGGTNWSTLVADTSTFTSNSMSSDGTKLLYSKGSTLYYSSNSGSSFSIIRSNTPTITLIYGEISKDGKTIMLYERDSGGSIGKFYISVDSGVNWIETLPVGANEAFTVTDSENIIMI